MKKSLQTFKFCVAIFALPIVATAAAAAHQQMIQTEVISVSVPASTTAVSHERVHTVAIDSDGAVNGRVGSFNSDQSTQGLAGLNVRFVQDGKVVAEAFTDADGSFVIDGISEGVYSFIAKGDNAFAAYGVRVVSDASGKVSKRMEAIAVSPSFNAVQKIVNAGSSAPASSVVKGDEMPVNGSSRVALTNGVLKGHLASAKGKIVSLEKTYVHILQNGILVAKVEADSNGDFEVPGVKAGVYDFVAAGPYGIAAVAIEVVEGFEQQVNAETSEFTFVSTNPEVLVQEPVAASSVDVYMVDRQDVQYADQMAYQGDMGMGCQPIEYASESIGCGCAGGSFGPVSQAPVGGRGFGGGGGGFGGGGGGRLLGIAGLALGIAAIADNNNPSPASPSSF
ncbi:MAG: hypothetical protein ACI87E_000267 [Mariniblastus sp.]|jgi:hypothetical protein